MTNLNTDQQRSLINIINWWADGHGSKLYHVLDGFGGSGKTFLVDTILQRLPNCTPLICAPTHEALYQLREKITGDYDFRTLHSALGITPIDGKQELEFEHKSLPESWYNYNLIVLDESSMVSQWLLDILISSKTRILFIGHKSQLPPIDIRRGILDKCVSPVFVQGWDTSTLTIPVRNTGKLFEFNDHLERMIYSNERIVPNTFDVPGADLREYLDSPTGKEDVLVGNTKMVLWSNDGVDQWNKKLRDKILGVNAPKYLPTDKIILTAPICVIPNLEEFSDRELSKLDYTSEGLDKCYSNTKAEVVAVEVVTVSLNRSLIIHCYKIEVVCSYGENRFFYEPINPDALTLIGEYYKQIAWRASNKSQKIKEFKRRSFILSCFSSIKHYYAATSYRLQGCTIPNIIVINNDICKVRNQIEAKKHRYVACSRASTNLMFYRGL